MKDVLSLSISGNNLWAASTGGLFSFNITSPAATIKKYTTFDGLQDNELESSAIDNSGNVWAGANDGSVSVYNPVSNTWRAITDIKLSTEASKGVNNLFLYGNYMFISTDFSLIKFSVPQFQFTDQPYTTLGSIQPKSPVYYTIVVNDTVWAGTKNGIAYANINSNLPIASNWSNFTVSNSVMKSNKVNTIAYFDNKVFFGTDSGMVYFSNHNLYTYSPNGAPAIDGYKSMAVSGNSLYFSTYTYSNNIYKADRGNINNAQQVINNLPINSMQLVSDGSIYAATQLKGVEILANNTNTSIVPNGPFSNLFYSVTVDMNKNLWAVSGPLGNWADLSGIYKFNASTWKNFTYDQNPIMGNGCCGLVQIYASQFTSDAWVGSLGNGLIKISNDNLTRYTDTNSILKSYGGPGFVIAMCLCEDNSGNLWLMNNYTTQPLVNFTQQQSYPIPIGNSSAYFFTGMVIDNYNTKWAVLSNTEILTPRGLLYYNESINSAKLIQPADLGQDVTGCTGIILEKNGEIWVATNNGIVIIADPSQVVNNPNSVPTTTKMRLIENGLSTPLTDYVVSLNTDAINNKWIGTSTNGLLYVSPDGTTLIYRYNTVNSPVADNNILSVATDPGSGKVYFGTNKGLSSYGTIAVEPLADCSKITAGPNPFIIPNDNLLRIDGLVAESTVKILTISGTLVAEFDSPGGRIANWDGRDQNGNLVSSGIYIIAGFTKDASKVCTGKVAIVRK